MVLLIPVASFINSKIDKASKREKNELNKFKISSSVLGVLRYARSKTENNS